MSDDEEVASRRQILRRRERDEGFALIKGLAEKSSANPTDYKK
jgi:hypothetical protein